MENKTVKVFRKGIEIDKVRVRVTIGRVVFCDKVDEYGNPVGGRPYYDLDEPGITIKPWTPKSKQEKHDGPQFEPLVPAEHGVLGIIQSPDPDYPGL